MNIQQEILAYFGDLKTNKLAQVFAFCIALLFILVIVMSNTNSNSIKKLEKNVKVLEDKNTQLQKSLDSTSRAILTSIPNIDSTVNAKLFAPLMMKKELGKVKNDINKVQNQVKNLH